MLIPMHPLITREVNMGPRKIASDFINESSEKLLENGRNLRKSKDFPIKCRIRPNRIWRKSKAECETICGNTSSLPMNPYQQAGSLTSQ